jgi:hypothetical protein
MFVENLHAYSRAGIHIVGQLAHLGLENKPEAREPARARSGSARLGAAREPRASRAEPARARSGSARLGAAREPRASRAEPVLWARCGSEPSRLVLAHEPARKLCQITKYVE